MNHENFPENYPVPVILLQGDQMRPRVVKRGVSDFESIDEGMTNMDTSIIGK